jgi:hypothetical protein
MGKAIFKTEVLLNRFLLLLDNGYYLLIVAVRVNLYILYGGNKNLTYRLTKNMGFNYIFIIALNLIL